MPFPLSSIFLYFDKVRLQFVTLVIIWFYQHCHSQRCHEGMAWTLFPSVSCMSQAQHTEVLSSWTLSRRSKQCYVKGNPSSWHSRILYSASVHILIALVLWFASQPNQSAPNLTKPSSSGFSCIFETQVIFFLTKDWNGTVLPVLNNVYQFYQLQLPGHFHAIVLFVLFLLNVNEWIMFQY